MSAVSLFIRWRPVQRLPKGPNENVVPLQCVFVEALIRIFAHPQEENFRFRHLEKIPFTTSKRALGPSIFLDRAICFPSDFRLFFSPFGLFGGGRGDKLNGFFQLFQLVVRVVLVDAIVAVSSNCLARVGCYASVGSHASGGVLQAVERERANLAACFINLSNFLGSPFPPPMALPCNSDKMFCLPSPRRWVFNRFAKEV